MAKTTPGKPKGKPKKDAEPSLQTGPVLVEDPPEPASPDDFEEDVEETATEEPARAPLDTRTIPRAGDLPPTEFFAFALQHPDPAWVDLYVHRVVPKVVNIPPPEWPSGKKFPAYCERVKGLITEETGRVFDYEWLVNKRGSGKYHLRLVDRRLKRTENRLICQAHVEINEYDKFPPVLNDWGELVPCTENNWIIDKLLKQKVIKRTPEGGFVAYEVPQNGTGQQQQTNPNDPTAMLKATVGLAKDLAASMTPKAPPSVFSGDNLVTLITKNQEANDPQKLITAARGLLEIAKPAEVKPDTTALDLVKDELRSMRAELAEERKANRDLQNRILDMATKPAAAAQDPIDVMKKSAEGFKAMREVMGPSEEQQQAVSKMNGWQEFLQAPITELLSGLKPFFQVGAQIVLQKMTQGNQTQQPQTQQPQRPAAAPAPAPAAVTQPQQPAAAGAESPAPAAAPADAPPKEVTPEVISPEQAQQQAEARAMITALAYVMPTMLDYLKDENDLDGWDFAALFCDMKVPTGLPMPFNYIIGVEALGFIRKYDPERILELIELNSPPMFQDLIPTPDRRDPVIQFVRQFQSFDPKNADKKPADLKKKKG